VRGSAVEAPRVVKGAPAGDDMNDDRFDAIARLLSTSPTRRKTFGLITATVGSGFLLAAGGSRLGDLLGLAEIDAADKKSRRKKRKKQRRRKRRRRQRNAGPALYPDLRTLPPGDLRFDEVTNPGRVLLRFSNTIMNEGPGRLELEGDADPNKKTVKKVYQNLYDAPIGGTRVSHTRINGRIIYHAAHSHFHFADFAAYELLKKDGSGNYLGTGAGTKTSFCITDNDPQRGGYPPQYTTCQRQKQGLTPGWGDTYGAHLPEQWIDVGEDELEDGEYGLKSTVDPLGLLNEGGGGGEGNNTAITYFTVDGGDIVVHEGP
jgi:hypothetical protein